MEEKPIDKSNMKVCNLALIGVCLPDIEGVTLLAKFKEPVPRMRKIIITGFPSIQNAIEAVNNKADGYMLKPFEIGKIWKESKSIWKNSGKKRNTTKIESQNSLKQESENWRWKTLQRHPSKNPSNHSSSLMPGT